MLQQKFTVQVTTLPDCDDITRFDSTLLGCHVWPSESGSVSQDYGFRSRIRNRHQKKYLQIRNTGFKHSLMKISNVKLRPYPKTNTVYMYTGINSISKTCFKILHVFFTFYKYFLKKSLPQLKQNFLKCSHKWPVS
jgi:hypothetical protein